MDRYERRVLRLRNHVLSHQVNKDEVIEWPANEEGVANAIAYDDVTKAQIADILKEKGIEHNPRDKKEDLYNLLLLPNENEDKTKGTE